MPAIKQVILIRKDLKMRRGKEVAQGAHAAMAFLVQRLRRSPLVNADLAWALALTPVECEWIERGSAKVCLRVNSEEELLEYHQRAIQAGLASHVIRDSGRTEFGGVPTLTACAIGPDAVEKIDVITAELVLY